MDRHVVSWADLWCHGPTGGVMGRRVVKSTDVWCHGPMGGVVGQRWCLGPTGGVVGVMGRRVVKWLALRFPALLSWLMVSSNNINLKRMRFQLCQTHSHLKHLFLVLTIRTQPSGIRSLSLLVVFCLFVCFVLFCFVVVFQVCQLTQPTKEENF